jgi:hypothetical protein
MIKIFAFLELLDSAIEAGVQAVAASSAAGIQSVHRAVTLAGVVLATTFVAGLGLANWVNAQKNIPERLTAVEIELAEKRNQDDNLYKMVCEIRATLRGSDPLACWRGEIEITQPGGR